jgi:L-lactate dehydrogenase complex protein LldG
LLQERGVRRVLLGRGPFLDDLNLAARLRALGMEVAAVDTLTTPEAKDILFAAEAGISAVHALIAETGSVVVTAAPAEPRSLSLLPPLHIVVAGQRQLVPDLFDLFESGNATALPSCLALITGPSKTGDIELRLVTGVHGPGELHVVLRPE